jgi:hypothetical protein
MLESYNRDDNKEDEHYSCDDELSFSQVKRHCVLLGGFSAMANGQWRGFPGGEETCIRPIMSGPAHECWTQLLIAWDGRDCKQSLGEEMALAAAAFLTSRSIRIAISPGCAGSRFRQAVLLPLNYRSLEFRS